MIMSNITGKRYKILEESQKMSDYNSSKSLTYLKLLDQLLLVYTTGQEFKNTQIFPVI